MNLNEFLKFLNPYIIVEFRNNEDLRFILNDEYMIDDDNRLYVDEEDASGIEIKFLTKIWKEDENGNYILVWKKESDVDD